MLARLDLKVGRKGGTYGLRREVTKRSGGGKKRNDARDLGFW